MPGPHSILLIDDDGVSLAVIAMLLESEDYDVLQASSGEEALQTLIELAGSPQPSVVLADLQMPGRCGAELAADLKLLAPQSLLLAMSATPSAAEGYDGFLKKPLDVGDLRAALAARDIEKSSIRENDPDKSRRGKTRNPGVPAGRRELQREGPAPAAVASRRILDEKIFRNLLRMMSASAVEELYAVCLRDAREKAGRIRAAGESGDLSAARQGAHAIKGGAGMVGAVRLAEAAEEIEFGISVKEDLPQLLNNLLERCDELQRILLDKLTP